MMRKAAIYDTIIVGAGAAGLSGAAEAARRGLSCLVLEADSRVGGRTWTDTDSMGAPVDRGAQLVNSDMTRVTRLAVQHGFAILPLPKGGLSLMVDDNGPSALDEETLPHPARDVQALAAAIPPDADVSVANLLRTVQGDEAEASLSFVEEMASKDPEVLSARALLRLAETYASARHDAEAHLSHGFGGLTAAMAAELPVEIRLGHVVDRIESDGTTFRVSGAGFDPILCRSAVIAVPPVPAQRIELPEPVRSAVEPLLRSFVSGDMIKYFIRYPSAFWKDRGLSGSALFLGTDRFSTIDSSRPDIGRAGLTVFVGGSVARRWANQSGKWRQDKLRSSLATAFGSAAAAPEELVEQIWIDHPLSGGGYNGQVRIGGIPDAADRIHAISGPIVFAGAEYAQTFRGFVEGALCDGEAAIGRLKSIFPDEAEMVGQAAC